MSKLGSLKNTATRYLSAAISLVVLTGCLGSHSGSHSGSHIQAVIQSHSSSVLAPALPGNVEVAENDEAPIVTDENGKPVRQDREGQNKLIQFSGFNEE